MARCPARQSIYASRKVVDGLRAVEGADLDVVLAGLSWRPARQLPTRAGVTASGVPIGGRLHRHSVDPLAEHPPHRVEWKLLLPVDLVRTQPEAAIDDSDGHRAGGFGDSRVLVALFREGRVRPREPPVIAGGVFSHRQAL